MGMIINAYCEKCGFKKKFYFGAGFTNFNEVCNVPAINKKTGKFVVKNIRDLKNHKNNFDFYDDPKMYQGKLKDDELEWDEIKLKENGNYCPQCKGFTMSFISMGCFD